MRSAVRVLCRAAAVTPAEGLHRVAHAVQSKGADALQDTSVLLSVPEHCWNCLPWVCTCICSCDAAVGSLYTSCYGALLRFREELWAIISPMHFSAGINAGNGCSKLGSFSQKPLRKVYNVLMHEGQAVSLGSTSV